MKQLYFIAAITVCAVSASAAMAEPASTQCDVPKMHSLGDLDSALSRRAVEAVNLAASSQVEKDRLDQLVDPGAPFGSGGGDVGLPLGQGIDGIRALARDMRADTFRYILAAGLPIMMREQDRCADRTIQVEFVRTADQTRFDVRFAFKAGKIVSAQTWTEYYVGGPVKAVQDRP